MKIMLFCYLLKAAFLRLFVYASTFPSIDVMCDLAYACLQKCYLH